MFALPVYAVVRPGCHSFLPSFGWLLVGALRSEPGPRVAAMQDERVSFGVSVSLHPPLVFPALVLPLNTLAQPSGGSVQSATWSVLTWHEKSSYSSSPTAGMTSRDLQALSEHWQTLLVLQHRCVVSAFLRGSARAALCRAFRCLPFSSLSRVLACVRLCVLGACRFVR